jgi:DNA-binding NtrC family response regulator
MTILLFDSNVVYAKQVAGEMAKHLNDADIHMAHNTAVLRHRLDNQHYDLVVADISAASDCELAADILREASKSMTIVVWSAVNGADATDVCKKCHATQILRKEFGIEGMKNAVAKAVRSSGHALPAVAS